MRGKQQLQVQFNQTNLTRQHYLFNQPRAFQQMLLFMDYTIRKQLKSFTLLSICGAERTTFPVDSFFKNGFNTCTLEEKVEMYQRTVNFARECVEKGKGEMQLTKNGGGKLRQLLTNIPTNDIEEIEMKVRVKVQKGFRSWQQIQLSIRGYKVVSNDGIRIDLRNYLLRKSKKKDPVCYLLQAIHKSQPTTIRFCFVDAGQKELEVIRNLVNRGYYESISRMVEGEGNGLKGMMIDRVVNKDKEQQQLPNSRKNSEKMCTLDNIAGSTSSFGQQKLLPTTLYNTGSLNPHQPVIQSTAVIKQIMKPTVQQNLPERLSYLIQKNNQMAKHKPKNHNNVLQLMLPCYNLFVLQQMNNFIRISSTPTNAGSPCYIYRSNNDQQLYKMQLLVNMQPQIVLKGLYNISLWKNWHPEVLQGEFKMFISSENSAIVYHKIQQYSQWYRQRDFVYLRHVFQLHGEYYIADRSIQNTNFVPFKAIHRGTIDHIVTKINQCELGSRVLVEMKIDYGDMLNSKQCQQLSIRFLKGYDCFQQYFGNKGFVNKLQVHFDHYWCIDESEEIVKEQYGRNLIEGRMNQSLRTEDFHQQSVEEDEGEVLDDELFFSIADLSDQQNHQDQAKPIQIQMQSEHEIDPDQQSLKSKQDTVGKRQIILLNQDGLIVLPKRYLKIRSITVPFSCNAKRIVNPHPHLLLRDRWGMLQDGGFVLINQKIIAAQNNVLKFIMTTLRNNIFSGRGVLNISLPVQIFNCDSNLQRLAYCQSLAPYYLEKAAVENNPMERMKYVLVHGLTNSLLYVDVEKPFNPILGETYQGSIAGCPIYAQQISHHPPISAIYMVGRGYKVHAALQSRVQLHINSGDGVNLGWYHDVFDDGGEVCFQTPPGEFSGFTIGARKYQMMAKGYYFDRKNCLYCEMNFEDQSTFFAANKWKFRDQVQAQILKVTPTFLDKFITAFPKKKLSPQSADIISRHQKITGRWPFEIFCDGELLYSVNGDLPYELEDVLNPLNSNSNYREDLYYRRMEDLSRSQSEKERLEIIQRGDRKLREKFHGKKH